jgi:hypothetical protein
MGGKVEFLPIYGVGGKPRDVNVSVSTTKILIVNNETFILMNSYKQHKNINIHNVSVISSYFTTEIALF